MEIIKKYWWVILVLLLLSIIGYLFPSYRSIKRINESQTRIIQEQDRKLKTRIKEKIVRMPVLVGERVVYKTIKETDTAISEEAHYNLDTSESVSSEETIVEKRGQFVLGFGLDYQTHISVLGQTTFLGPLGIGATATLSDGIAYAGFVTLAF